MDFDDTPAEAGFRHEARAWLAGHAQLRTGEEGVTMARAGREDHVARCKAWQATLHEHGWAGLAWPTEYGGGGHTTTEARIFAEEQARFDVETGIFAVGIGMVGPTLIAHGTDRQKERYLAPLLRGEEVWCQLFSEPGAGSDLAGLATRGECDGDRWIVNGQKVWTSGAQYSQFGVLLARTRPEAPKHRGITYFVVDMATPGIEVRPLRQINGAAHFNEVFFSDVEIPQTNVVGDVHGGWGVTLTTLANERALIGGASGGLRFEQLLHLARTSGATGDPSLRQDLAATYSRYEILRYLRYRVQTAATHDQPPGPESSIVKLVFSRHMEATGDLIMALSGPQGLLGPSDAPLNGLAGDHFLTQWASRIGGGTDQIQRNVIGERVLGLPAESRPDKTMPWNELERS